MKARTSSKMSSFLIFTWSIHLLDPIKCNNSASKHFEEQSILSYLMEPFNDREKHMEALQNTGFWGEQGAGCLILAQNTGRFLVALRSAFCQQPQTYGTIGGAIDTGESPIDAMRREVMEECGYLGEIIDIKPLYLFSKETRAGTLFNYHNFVVLIEHEFVAHEHWETEQFLWVTYEELASLHPKHFGLEELLLNSGNLLNEFAISYKLS